MGRYCYVMSKLRLCYVIVLYLCYLMEVNAVDSTCTEVPGSNLSSGKGFCDEQLHLLTSYGCMYYYQCNLYVRFMYVYPLFSFHNTSS
jgi:hypothetical protein